MRKVHQWSLKADDVKALEDYLEQQGFWNYAVEKTAYSLVVKIFTNDDAFIKKLVEQFRLEIIEHKVLEEKDWHAYLEMKPFFVAPGVIVDPTCKLRHKKGETLIKIWPSAAFGTGDHPTTKLAAQLIVENLHSIKSLLDVGCGTGILAIIAKKLGVQRVVAVDNDPVALEVAREFAARNRVKIDFLLSDLLSHVEATFDMVVANISTFFCIKLLGQIGKVSRKGTIVILSGIAEGEDEAVVEFAQSQNFEIIEKRGLEAWKAIMVRI